LAGSVEETSEYLREDIIEYKSLHQAKRQGASFYIRKKLWL
jgi:hypothetical protein